MSSVMIRCVTVIVVCVALVGAITASHRSGELARRREIEERLQAIGLLSPENSSARSLKQLFGIPETSGKCNYHISK